jgi:2-iminobutanoate/2-iminopropanoate deaminase
MSVELIRLGNALDAGALPMSAASRAGDTIQTGGLLPFDPETGMVVNGGVEAQARRVLENARLVLEAAGSSLEHVTLVQVYLVDIQRDFGAFNGVYGEFFAEHHPPRCTVGGELAFPGLRVEIQMTAVVAAAAQPERGATR